MENHKNNNDENLENKHLTTLKQCQELVKYFAQKNNWPDIPNIDKFDHLHEELIEMSQHLRYKNEQERIDFVNNNKDIFTDGIGDLFFGMCRLANQLGVDIETAFNQVKTSILERYYNKDKENNIVRKG
jgi:NTP pyrophosphatase (non-canonical NTP hydrolase)